jgi:hypothetical protein
MFYGKALPGLIYSGVAELALRFIISSKWEMAYNGSRVCEARKGFGERKLTAYPLISDPYRGKVRSTAEFRPLAQHISS